MEQVLQLDPRLMGGGVGFQDAEAEIVGNGLVDPLEDVNQLASVSSLGFWDGSKWYWSLDWKRALRPRDVEDLDHLLSIVGHVSLDVSSSDKFIWAPDKNGRFSVSSITKELDKTSPMVSSDIFKSLWKGLVPHRIDIFVWFALMGKLNTKGKLVRLSIIPPSEASCSFCKQHIEDEEHLFIHCELSRKLWYWWFALWDISWVLPRSLKDLFLQWNNCHADCFFKKVWKATFCIILWTLWKERNARVFSNIVCSDKQLQDMVLLRLCWWIKGWQDPFPYSSNEVMLNPKCLKGCLAAGRNVNPAPSHEIPLWSPPPQSSFKWNTDASLDPIRSRSAIGGVLRDSFGNFMCIFSCPIPHLEINSAEVYALFRAVKISLSSPLINSNHLIFESDSANAVKWCNERSGGPWNLNFMLNFIRSAIHSHLNAKIIHKGRGSNAVADALAKSGIRRENDFMAWL
ncbi:uncharacterized protein LOC125498918 [Beta vulgaris subsp. vulgaris]|uniref:uncharacterized protein LOC125498918 n=1 Tax=Beta vulgaris subsp. vulgaris TaxID=3555 RepID=UPI0020371F0F|nr:uncharacterized protein LOC125498918 [Beta vulgaris subsp. vulgaris]